MVSATVYSTAWCPYCVRARGLLERRGVGYHEIRVDLEAGRRQEMQVLSGRHTVPQIWIGETHVGGYTDLLALDQNGVLAELIGGGTEQPSYSR